MTQGRKILITGGTGNIGQLLARKLKDDGHFVCCLDLSEPSQSKRVDNVRYEAFDIRENKKLESLFKALQPDIVFHLASLLSGSSELDRRKAIDINLLSSFNLLELAVESATATFVFPGTGASYSPEVPKDMPEDQEQWPENIYGATKVAVERLGVYYKQRHGLDFRCLRPPLVLSPFAPPSALTAYASLAHVAAFENRPFVFPVSPDVGMSTIYIQDLVNGFVQLAFAERDRLHRNAYNLHAFRPSAEQVAELIRLKYPEFQYSYEPDTTVEGMLNGSPDRFDDASARKDWGWDPKYNLEASSKDIFRLLEEAAP